MEDWMRPQELLALILSGLLGVGVLAALLLRTQAERVPVPVQPPPDVKKPGERQRRPLFPRPRHDRLGDL